MQFTFGVEKDFFIGSVYCRYHLFDISKPVVITFAPDNVGLLDKEMLSKGRTPWGFKYISKLGFNVISFAEMRHDNSYYRNSEFINSIDIISAAIPKFPERLGYGGSMGGYGVTAFANSLKLDRLLAFNPISTRNKNIASWDFEAKRSLWSFEQDWEGYCSDGAESQCSGYIIYDPLYDLDKKHAKRYTKLKHLKLPGVGHGVANYMQQLGMLDTVVKEFLDGKIDEKKFYKNARMRRKLQHYYTWMTGKENKYLTPKRKSIIEKYRDKMFAETSDNNISSGKISDVSAKKISSGKIDGEDVNNLLEAAIILEKNDIKLSYSLMRIARQYRPKGVKILRKLKEYEIIIGNTLIDE
ncbi:hypothetical protein [Cobetia sp. MC34]|uniref:hypothetical protein n=1 Tax=Cobetia sp. MC34 TaxID=2785080 RepID=UPI001BC9BA14|nr:hypothetical protein [Cobetia sp. MC34]MBS4154769.1 hypothetical protein [Cobetia sp. MC34]